MLDVWFVSNVHRPVVYGNPQTSSHVQIKLFPPKKLILPFILLYLMHFGNLHITCYMIVIKEINKIFSMQTRIHQVRIRFFFIYLVN